LLGLGEGVGLKDKEGVGDGLSDGLGDGVGLGEFEGVGEGLELAVGVGVDVNAGVTVGDTVGKGVGVAAAGIAIVPKTIPCVNASALNVCTSTV
jgi:hypothetical protein